jgi:hypothetical protein
MTIYLKLVPIMSFAENTRAEVMKQLVELELRKSEIILLKRMSRHGSGQKKILDRIMDRILDRKDDLS